MNIGPTARCAGLLAIGASIAFAVVLIAGVRTSVAFAALGVIVFVALIVDLVTASAHSRITVTRRHPPVLVMGTQATMEWDVRSDLDRSVRVMIAEPLAPSLGAVSRRFMLTVPPRSTVEVTTELRPSRRGRFELDHMTVRLVGWLGLVTRQRDVPLVSVLRVHPRFRSVAEAELRVRRARQLQIGTRVVASLGGGTEFEQLREYVVDDEYRHVDWTATARVGRPVVRTYRAEKNQHVLVLLDNGRVQAGLVVGVPRVEYSMDAAMMLATVANGLGDHCGLVGFDSRIRSVVPPRRSRDQVSRVTEAMFDVEPELAESDYLGAFSFTVERFRRRMMIVLLTDIVDQAISGALIPALPTLLRKHLVVVAAVRDPLLEEWALDPTFTMSGEGSGGSDIKSGEVEVGLVDEHERVARRIAAMDTLMARKLSVAKLRSLGAVVIDAPPDRMASELGDAYLRIKGSGRL